MDPSIFPDGTGRLVVAAVLLLVGATAGLIAVACKLLEKWIDRIDARNKKKVGHDESKPRRRKTDY